MKRPITLLAICMVMLFSCNSGNGQNSQSNANDSLSTLYDSSLVAGRLLDTVACKDRPGHSYALYLPSTYSPKRKFPVIYFFDAHARGAMPLRLYKDLADKYGFVLIGSNMSKNGMSWDAGNEVAKAMMGDSRSRINIDADRIYVSGFSGGSRVAASVALFDGGVRGVVGCAAGFPSVQHVQNKFEYFGLVGEYDFNMPEMENLDGALDQNGFTHQLITFPGKHDWPPASEFNTAMQWLLVNEFKQNISPANKSIIGDLQNGIDARIKAARQETEWIKVYQLTSGARRIFDGLLDVSAYTKQLSVLTSGEQFQHAVALQQKLDQQEQDMQQELATQFTSKDEAWWKTKIAELNQKTRNTASHAEADMYKRLIAYTGFVGYMNSNHSLQSGELGSAATYLQIFKMADPENPDQAYLTAIYYMKRGNGQQAISSLREAASLGYSDMAQLTADPMFNSLHDNPGFKEILTKVDSNSRPAK